MDKKMKAGQYLRKLIKENYSSQEEFAYDYGIDVRTVSRYVNKQGLDSIDLIQELAAFFQVDFFDFFKD